MKVTDLTKLLEVISKTRTNEVTLETADYKLSIKRGEAAQVSLAVPSPAPTAAPTEPVVSAVSGPTQAAPAEATPASVDSSLLDVSAPIVGTFYTAPSPDAPPYIKLGDRVSAGQVLCIIEAMKLMNEIEAEVAGTIAEILVKNEEPVEYGQVLFRIDPQ